MTQLTEDLFPNLSPGTWLYSDNQMDKKELIKFVSKNTTNDDCQITVWNNRTKQFKSLQILYGLFAAIIMGCDDMFYILSEEEVTELLLKL